MPTRLTGILRENVAALVVRADGRILLGECADKPGWWSLPQGGVEHSETWREALVRELAEETGLRPRQYEVVERRSGYGYLYPGGRLKKGVYRGQLQTYFRCQLVRGEPVIGGRGRSEFLQLRWVEPPDLELGLIPPFKREVTRRVWRDFFGVDLAALTDSEDIEDDGEDVDALF